LEGASPSAKLLANLGGTQPGVEGAPRRRFGALTGRVSMPADFDAPLKTDEAPFVNGGRNPTLNGGVCFLSTLVA